MHKLIAIITFALALIACGSTVVPTGSGGGSMSTTDIGGSGGATATTTMTTSSTTSTTTTDPGPLCGSNILKPFDCSKVYPDPRLAFDPNADTADLVGPASGESPNGAVAGRVDQNVGSVVAVRLFVPFELPAVIRVAVWQEAVCGVPTILPGNIPWQDVKEADTTEPVLPDILTRLPLGTAVALTPAKGQTWVALALTDTDVLIATSVSVAGAHEPRFAWLGLADADCDGSNDDVLGWEDIRTPSANNVDDLDADLLIGVEMHP